jgi:ADP-ribosyl-[dinitrogen reductase] hydrolase
MTSPPANDRRIGALVGLAIGDALGAAVEFKPTGTFEPVTGYRAGGPHGLNAGEWTDDTSLALALADSLAVIGWDLNDQATRYLSWYRTGEYSVNGRCFDIGNATRRALLRFAETGDGATSGPADERSAGNGSIMRLAPVPIFFADLYPERADELIRYGYESSLPTHRAPQATSACAYMTLVLAALMAGEPIEVVLDPDWPLLDVLRTGIDVHPEVDEVIRGGFRNEPPAIKGSGYVVRSLEAALWALNRSYSFEEAVLAAVNLGDDADTTGAVCGQFAGPHWGRSGIPQHLLDGLAQRDRIEGAAQRLLERTEA